MSAYWSTMVAGVFDRSREHQPTDRATLRAAALELRSRGLTYPDIGAALKLSESAVRALLEEAKCSI